MKKIIFFCFAFFSSLSLAQVPATINYETGLNQSYLCNAGTCANKNSNCSSTRAGYTNATYCTSETGFNRRAQCANTANGRDFIKLKYAIASDANQRCTYGSCPTGLVLKSDRTCGCPQVGYAPALRGDAYVCLKILEDTQLPPETPVCSLSEKITVIDGVETCVPDLSSSSSAASSVASSAASSPVSSSASSAASSATSLATSSVASAASAASASAASTGSGTSAGTGTGTGTGTSSGSGSASSLAALTPMESCELTFGVDKCSVTTVPAPCPNSYTVGGQTFCVTVGSSSGTGSSSGSASGGTGTGTGTGEGEGEGECDPEASDYLQCATPEGGDAPDHTKTDSGLTSVDSINKSFSDRLAMSPVVSSLSAIQSVVTLSAPSCPVFSIQIFNRDISTDIHCTLWALIAVILSPIMIAIWSVLAFRIFASA